MITIRTSAEIAADREIVVKLPPETPIGKAALFVTILPEQENRSTTGRDLRRHFGTIRSGNCHSADNASIDADLAQAYGNQHE